MKLGHWLVGCIWAGTVLIAGMVGAADWPQWRGPNRDGTAPDFEIPGKLPARLRLVWKVEVGEGYSSPVIRDGDVYMMVRRGEREVFVGLNAETGRENWATGFEVPFTMHPAALTAGPGPKATCLVTDELVVGLGITELFAAVERGTGKLAWKHDYHQQFKPIWPETGASGSPLLFGSNVIVPIGTKGKGGPAAFDLKSGKVVWQYNGDGPSYAAPEIFTVHGKDQIVTFTYETLAGIDPRSARTMWSIPYVTPYGQNIVAPCVMGNRVIWTGVDRTIRAADIRQDAQGNQSLADAWEIKDHACYMSQALALEGHILFHSERQKGTLLCVNAETGGIAWESPPRMGDYVSFTRAGDMIFVLHNDATLRAIKADTSAYEELGKWTVADGETWAWPAFLGRRIYVKDTRHLYLWEWGSD